ncbi:anti-sigma-I factor RsgI family protein [Fictibacillus arsenicus]|uniref:RsgI N-terminal anti-sigma domain-containing protein n=1 Tax=Fictibacillus arsenicus TaxID=255247 RepID=A0A1V3GBE2_9BACL|nr:hypothetical protein [Fictibacillus arsenicus]OOE14189.1 hypothetical protein UN64_03005 [Fictibacillus arsenicus]
MKSGSGIVIEVNNRKATLLMKDGTFVTLRVPAGKNPSVGREYQASYFSENRKRSLFVLPSVAAILAVVLLSGLIPTGTQSAAAAYVSFDINPSLEVGVNEEMQVIQIDAFNDEARNIIKKYNLNVDRDFSFENFADQLITAYEKEGYMKTEHSMLITTISSEEGNDKTEAALDKAVNSIVKKTVVKYPVAITVSESDSDTREKAKKLGVSPGKYKAFQTANINGKTLKEEKIKEVNFQELKVNTLSSNDIKSIPHPRKIKTDANESKKELKIAVPKKAVSKQKEVKKLKENHHNQDNHHNKKQEKLVQPKEKKLNNDGKKHQNRPFNSNKQKNNGQHNRNPDKHHKKNQQDRNKQGNNKQDRDKHRNKH